MSHRPADPCLLSLAPDTMDALRFARWHGSLPDLDGLEADIRTLQPAGVPPRPLAAAKPWHDTMAACLEAQTVVALRARYGAALCIEPDASFRHQAAPMGARGLPAPAAPAAAGIRPEGTALHFRVTDPEGAPIAGARLWAEGAELDPGLRC
jgi:hypothetical protein